MATRYAVANGNWSNAATWNGGTLPTSADTVVANGFTVTIDISVTAVQFRTLALSPAVSGGGFVINDGVTVTGPGLAGTTTCFTYSGTGTSPTVVGDISGSNSTPAAAYGLLNSSTGTISVLGNVIGGSQYNYPHGIHNASSGTVNVTGNVTGGGYNSAYLTHGINNVSTGTINVTGNVYGANGTNGSWGYGIANLSSGTVNVTGMVSGGTQSALGYAFGIGNQSTGTVNITGSCTGNTSEAIYSITAGRILINGTLTAGSVPAVTSTHADAYNRMSGPFIDSSVGVSAIVCRRVAMARDTTIAATHWKAARAALTVPNYDDYRFLYTAGTSIGNPAVGDVRYNTVFGPNSEFTGGLRVPSPSYVSQGVLTDNTVGTMTASSPDLLVSTTIATLASQTSFTLTAGPIGDNSLRGARVIITNAAGTQKCVGMCGGYVGSTKTVTLSSDPGVFTIAVGDSVSVVASNVNVTQLLGTAWLTPATAGTPDINVKTMATDSLTAAALKADAVAEIQSGLATTSDTNAIANQISGLNNLSALANLYGPSVLEIPDSGTTPFAFTLVVRDNEGKLVALDSSPTITAANAAGTDRSANLSAISNPSTGRYTFTYSTGAAHAQESLRITCSGAVSTELRYVEWIGSVVNYDMTTAIQTAATKATEAANQTTATAIRTSIGLNSADLSSTLGTLATEANATTNKNAVLAAIPSASVIADAVDTLQSTNHGSGPWGSSGAGTGARTVTITVRNSSNVVLQNAKVRCLINGVTAATGDTNASGVFVAMLDDGTYTVTATCSHYVGSSQSVVVNGTEDVSFSLSAITITPPSIAGRTTGLLNCYAAGVQVTIQQIGIPKDSEGELFNGDEHSTTAGVDQVAQFADLVKGARYRMTVDGKKTSFTVPANAGNSFNIPSAIDA